MGQAMMPPEPSSPHQKSWSGDRTFHNQDTVEISGHHDPRALLDLSRMLDEDLLGHTGEHEKIKPSKRKKKLPRALMLAVAAFLIFAGVAYAASLLLARSGEGITVSEQALRTTQSHHGQFSPSSQVAPSQHIVIRADAGNVHLQTRAGINNVEVSPALRDHILGSNFTGMNLEYTNLSDGSFQVNIHLDPQWSTDHHRLDLFVTIPENSPVQIDTTSGDVKLDLFTGDIQVNTSSGDVDLNNISGSASVQTLSGDIDIDNVDGSLNIQAQSGDVKIKDASLHADSIWKTVSGKVQFDGSLLTGGSYRVETLSGDISLQLTDQSVVQIQTLTTSGSMENELGSSFGNGPLAPVDIHSASGNIKIQHA